MITLYHSPNSRSTRIVALLKDLDALDTVGIEVVTIPRMDGTGARDPRNPHPDGKVPLLDQDGVLVWESSAIVQHLAELFPDAGLSVPAGDPRRGAYLSWLAWYAGVVEPVLTLQALGIDHPGLSRTFRTADHVKARLAAALADRPYLLGEHYTAADLLLHSPYAWFGKPGLPAIDAWVDRCTDRPGARFAAEFDAAHGG
ncbi:glutathione S-transferase family protein [Methylorubrum suomiense]|uniref:Glutathione S-transferase GST-6.0 n=1 Tax=Methylorubrum suomiense TaxID=144191 RepID=A0ABQ4UT61_9HYPH|nr:MULTISPECIES: glutathione S-transferase family protein [Methylobacteriaceae]GJE75343.1 Glutathione S-transferase GST-6.0 [Methylorubrum suomiense]